MATWIRYFSAFSVYLGIVAASVFVARLRSSREVKLQFLEVKRPSVGKFFVIPDTGWEKILIIIIGIMTFGLFPVFQMRGLLSSLATENSIIVALEPLMAAFLAWVILSESVTRFDFVGFCLALVGFGFLAGVHPIEFGRSLWRDGLTGDRLDPHLSGNLLIALSLVGEAVFAIAGKKLIRKYAPLAVFGSALAVGVTCLTGTLVVSTLLSRLMNGLTQERGTLNEAASYLFQFGSWDWKTFAAAIWIGPLGTTLGYLIYILALVDVSVVTVSLFLFLQPLAGALLGYLLLGERLNGLQSFGSILILFAVLFPNALRLRNRTPL